MQQPLRQCRQIMAAVEAIGKLSQVACAVLVVLDPVIRRIQGHFHVAQHDVDTAQRRVLRRLAPTAGDVALMAGAHRADLSKAARAIGDHVGIRGQRRIGPTPDDLAGKAGHRRQADALRALLRIGLHCRHEGRLVQGRAPAMSVASALATQVGIVDFNTPLQRAGLIAQAHHLQQLVLEQPGAFVAHAQLAPERQRADAILVLADQIQGEKPFAQGQTGVLHDGACGDRALVIAPGALPQAARMRVSGRPKACALTARAAPAL